MIDRPTKKVIHPNPNENSDDFKNLGTFHREKRQLDYYPIEAISSGKPGPTEIS